VVAQRGRGGKSVHVQDFPHVLGVKRTSTTNWVGPKADFEAKKKIFTLSGNRAIPVRNTANPVGIFIQNFRCA
jgi:hypothetical protein